MRFIGVFRIFDIREAHGTFYVAETVAAEHVTIRFSVFGIISVVGARYRDAGEDIARFTGIARRIVGDFDFFIKVGRFGNEVYGNDGGFIDEACEFTGSGGIFKVGNAVVVVGFADDADKVRFGQVEKEKAGCLLCVGIKRDVRAGNISIIR